MQNSGEGVCLLVVVFFFSRGPSLQVNKYCGNTAAIFPKGKIGSQSENSISAYPLAKAAYDNVIREGKFTSNYKANPIHFETQISLRR